MNIIDRFIQFILYVDEHPLIVILFVLVLCISVAYLIKLSKKAIIFIMGKLNNKEEYSDDELRLTKIHNNNDKYYAIDYYVWQENKLKLLQEKYQIDNKFRDKLTIVENGSYYKTVYNKSKQDYQRIWYKREFRVYAEYKEPQRNHNGDIVKGDKITNYGSMILHKKEENQIEKIINDIINENGISEEDKNELENIKKTIENKSYSKKENKTLIDIISKYSGIISNISTTIEVLRKFF